MKYQKLIIFVLIALFIALAITTSTIKEHKKEIDRLRQRVMNLETVINYDRKPSEPKSEPKIKQAVSNTI